MEISEKCYSEFTVSPTRRQSRRRGGSNRDVVYVRKARVSLGEFFDRYDGTITYAWT